MHHQEPATFLLYHHIGRVFSFRCVLEFRSMLNMFRTLIYPSSGACDYSVELPHWSYCSWSDVCWRFGVVGLEWYPCCRLKPTTRIPHTTNVVIQ